MKTIVRSWKSSLSPWEVFQNIRRQSNVCFFLDSIKPGSNDQRYSILGSHPALTLKLSLPGPLVMTSDSSKTIPKKYLFHTLRHFLKQYAHAGVHPFFTGGWVGFWGYETAALFDHVQFSKKKSKTGYPDLFLGFYHDVIVFDHFKKCYFLCVTRPSKEEGLQRLKVFFSKAPEQAKNFRYKNFHPQTKASRFKTMVQKAKTFIQAGDVYQANLSQKFEFDWSGDSAALYESLRDVNPSPFSSFLKVNDLEILSASPERLVVKRGNHCETKPIAGTHPRRKTGKSIRQLEQMLRANPKERAEHIMLVDLERNDLGRVCDWKSIKVEELMKIEKYSHVIHLVSRISGNLKKEKDGWDLLAAVFPGGTITGCPKIRCMQVIDELEPSRRGIYTGSIGYAGFRGDMDWNIVIRSFVLNKHKGFVQAGAGIVYDSDPQREYEETLHKGQALIEALQIATIRKTRDSRTVAI